MCIFFLVLHKAHYQANILLACLQRLMPKKKQFYAVAIGRKVGIYQSWDDCKKQVCARDDSGMKMHRVVNMMNS